MDELGAQPLLFNGIEFTDAQSFCRSMVWPWWKPYYYTRFNFPALRESESAAQLSNLFKVIESHAHNNVGNLYTKTRLPISRNSGFFKAITLNEFFWVNDEKHGFKNQVAQFVGLIF